MTLTDVVRPLLKDYAWLVDGPQIVLSSDAGMHVALSDSDGRVRALLENLDGTRTVEELTESLSHSCEMSREEVVAAITALDESELLEDAAADARMTSWEQERYFSNLAFFATFASLATSRYSFQARLRRSHVVLLGVGGLGSTLLFNLAGLGVGRITAVDSDHVQLKNLSRQFLYSEAEVGLPKLAQAVRRAQSFNSRIEITPVERRVAGPTDIAPLLPGADLVLSAIDQPSDVQDWVNETCMAAGVPFITGGMQTRRGLYYSVDPGRSGCLACWKTWRAQYSEGRPSFTERPRVNRGLGPAASLIASLIALEAVRYLTGFAPPISPGKLWLVDFATGRLDVGLEWPRLPDCVLCARATADARRLAHTDGRHSAPDTPRRPW